MAQVVEEFDVDELLDTVIEKNLMVYNDNINTFQWVIFSFIKVLNHTLEQAEQCAMIIHNKGKCSVKVGSHDELKPYCDALTERGINAKIE